MKKCLIMLHEVFFFVHNFQINCSLTGEKSINQFATTIVIFIMFPLYSFCLHPFPISPMSSLLSIDLIGCDMVVCTLDYIHLICLNSHIETQLTQIHPLIPVVLSRERSRQTIFSLLQSFFSESLIERVPFHSHHVHFLVFFPNLSSPVSTVSHFTATLDYFYPAPDTSTFSIASHQFVPIK